MQPIEHVFAVLATPEASDVTAKLSRSLIMVDRQHLASIRSTESARQITALVSVAQAPSVEGRNRTVSLRKTLAWHIGRIGGGASPPWNVRVIDYTSVDERTSESQSAATRSLLAHEIDFVVSMSSDPSWDCGRVGGWAAHFEIEHFVCVPAKGDPFPLWASGPYEGRSELILFESVHELGLELTARVLCRIETIADQRRRRETRVRRHGDLRLQCVSAYNERHSAGRDDAARAAEMTRSELHNLLADEVEFAYATDETRIAAAAALDVAPAMARLVLTPRDLPPKFMTSFRQAIGERPHLTSDEIGTILADGLDYEAELAGVAAAGGDDRFVLGGLRTPGAWRPIIHEACRRLAS